MDQAKKEEKAINEQLGIKVELLARGGESNVYIYKDKYGNKNIIKVSFNDNEINKQNEEIKYTKKTMKLLGYGELTLDGEQTVYYQNYKFGGPDLSRMSHIIFSKYKNFMTAFRLAMGVCSLHSIGIVHRDIKPSNILLDNELKITIIDFGLSEKVDDEKMYNNCGTPVFQSPELLYNKEIPGEDLMPADIYALGITLFNIFTGTDVCLGRTRILKHIEYLKDQNIEFLPNETKEMRIDFFNLIINMLSYNEDPDKGRPGKDRPTAKEVLETFINFYIKIVEAENKKFFFKNFKNNIIKLKPGEKLFIEENFPNAYIQIELEDIKKYTQKIIQKEQNLSNDCKSRVNSILNNVFCTDCNIDNTIYSHLNIEDYRQLKSFERKLITLNKLFDNYIYNGETTNASFSVNDVIKLLQIPNNSTKQLPQ